MKILRPTNLLIVALLVGGFLLLFTGLANMARAGNEPHKVFVCKYVGTPGVNETLQTGDNPINTDAHSIPIFGEPGFESIYDLVGQEFADQQGKSIVIAVDEGQAEPDVSECPAPEEETNTPNETTTTTEATTTTDPTTTTVVTVTTQPPTPEQPELPFTGIKDWLLPLGLALVSVGGLLVRKTREV